MKKIIVFVSIFAFSLFLVSATFATETKQHSQEKYGKSQGQEQSQQTQKMSAKNLQEKNLMLVDHLIGTNVMNQKNEQVGEIDKVLVDPQQGKIGYVIVSGGGVLGVGDEKYIVPFNALQKQMSDEQILEGDRKEHKITFTVNQDKLKAVPKGDIETALTQEEMNEINEFYGVAPFWEDQGTERTQKQHKDMKKEHKDMQKEQKKQY